MTPRPLRQAAAALGLLLILALGLALPLRGDAQSSRSEVLARSMPAVVQVMAVDVQDGRLVPVGSGSGTIVDPGGAVLTNHHVLHDADADALHDLFVIGRFRAADRAPELVCAGSPARGHLDPELDLALIRCDRDLSGKPFRPSGWPTLPTARMGKGDIVPGEQIWVLGYPSSGTGTIHMTAGLVSGWTGERGGADSRAYMKTDAAITHGNSGGAAIDEDGNFIGVPTAFRVTTARQGAQAIAAGKVGLIRPLERAGALLEAARAGGADAGEGVTVTTRVVDATSGEPVEGATLIVLRAGVEVGEIEPATLADSALAWGHADAGGVVRTASPVPRGGRYPVALVAAGYRPLADGAGLIVSADAPDLFDPWGVVRLKRE